MADFLNSPQFITILICLFGQVVSYAVLISQIKQRQDYHDRDILRLEAMIGNEVVSIEKTIKEHREEVKAREIQHLQTVEMLKAGNTQILQSLARVETKLEMTSKRPDTK